MISYAEKFNNRNGQTVIKFEYSSGREVFIDTEGKQGRALVMHLNKHLDKTHTKVAKEYGLI